MRYHSGTSISNPHTAITQNQRLHLCNKGRCSGAIVLESRWDLLLRFIVPRQSVYPTLDQDQPELRVLIFTVDLEVLTHSDRLFDEVPEVLWDGWCQSYPQTKGICKVTCNTTQCDEKEPRIKQRMSTGKITSWKSRGAPADLRTRRILFPVTKRT